MDARGEGGSLFRFRRTPGQRPLIWAHRGASRKALENTIEAFSRGLSLGADGIELDVRTTADGTVVVLHDRDLRRVTEGRDERAAHELRTRELLAVELRDGHHVPTLADVLDLCDERGALVNVELKHDTHDIVTLAKGVARLLAGRPRVAARTLISSFEPKLLVAMAALSPTVPRALLVHHGQKLAHGSAATWIARALGARALHAERTLFSRDLAAAMRRATPVLNAWTVNDPTEARDLAALDVDGIITDVPDEIAAALAV